MGFSSCFCFWKWVVGLVIGSGVRKGLGLERSKEKEGIGSIVSLDFFWLVVFRCCFLGITLRGLIRGWGDR